MRGVCDRSVSARRRISPPSTTKPSCVALVHPGVYKIGGSSENNENAVASLGPFRPFFVVSSNRLSLLFPIERRAQLF